MDCQDKPHRYADHLKAWDRDYAQRGRVWGGAVRALPDLPQGARVLEMGCGDGKSLSAVPAGWKVVALDISLQALRLARRVNQEACFILADGCRLPLQSESFDAVFAYHVAGHLFLSERRALAAEVTRVLLPGGRLFFRDFSNEDMRAGQGEEAEPGTFRRRSGIITHYFREEEVAGIFSGLKMDLIHTHIWQMRIKGEELVRAEVEAIMVKS